MSDTPEWMKASSDRASLPPEIDTSVPHSARVYDYWLGGKDNFAVDREMGEATIKAFPELPEL